MSSRCTDTGQIIAKHPPAHQAVRAASRSTSCVVCSAREGERTFDTADAIHHELQVCSPVYTCMVLHRSPNARCSRCKHADGSFSCSTTTVTRFGLSSQIDDFVEHIDTELAKLEDPQQAAVDQLQAAVRSLWSDGVVDVYGSNYTRLSLPKSDVDCVLTSRSLVDTSPCAVLRQLAQAVRGRPWAKAVDFLECAKIPVLKVIYRAASDDQDTMLDLTCGHSPGHSGLSARDLVYSLQAEMPALRPLVLILKTHLQSRGTYL